MNVEFSGTMIQSSDRQWRDQMITAAQSIKEEPNEVESDGWGRGK
jgi:hypothetical protein